MLPAAKRKPATMALITAPKSPDSRTINAIAIARAETNR